MLPVLVSMVIAMLQVGIGSGERPIGPGVSARLAEERASAIGDLRYELAFDIPAARRDAVQGRAVVSLRLEAPHRLVFDFSQPDDRLRAVRVDGTEVETLVDQGHVVIPAGLTRAGINTVEFEFVAGDEALNRSDEFLYTLFVPARARLAFPSFDQPDLKARYRLQLTVPQGWQAVANGATASSRTEADGRATLDFEETLPLSTYVASFAAGRFAVETATRNGRAFRMFHRETDRAKVARNRDAIFDLHASALAWLESYTALPYPWGKFDFVLIPSFQFGGMEHAGAILYNASGLLLDESATQNQHLERASLIAHETAHMWFGDLVTMRWFDDVWMKEVMANFMAAKIVNPSFPDVNHDLRFLLAHHPAAYQVDRTAGANAIRQELANLDGAGQLYGPIIYQKAPIVMRQLEMILGADAFRDGLREYLRRYAYSNATWNDLVALLDARTSVDLAQWSTAWVEERGRPTVATGMRVGARGDFEGLEIVVEDRLGRGLVWPQRLQIALGYEDGVRTVETFINESRTIVTAPRGLDRPRFVLASGGGVGYGLFLLDEESRQYLLRRIDDVANPLARGAAWVTLWDNFIEGTVDARVLFDVMIRALPREEDEQNTERVLAYLTRLFWTHLSSDDRRARGPALEKTLRSGLARGGSQSQKAAWFNAYRDTVLSESGLAWLERVWRREESVEGLALAEPDEITMALELAVREVPRWEEILRVQAARTENPDRRERFQFVVPALSADPAVRERAFDRLRVPENRRREPWVLESLRYLNHPLRQEHARVFLRPALDLLREIQRTGDIFFPTRWIQSVLSGHSSREAAAIVRDFLSRELQYPQRLRWTILIAADELWGRESLSPSEDTPGK
jgi:aminopeptidase N